MLKVVSVGEGTDVLGRSLFKVAFQCDCGTRVIVHIHPVSQVLAVKTAVQSSHLCEPAQVLHTTGGVL